MMLQSISATLIRSLIADSNNKPFLFIKYLSSKEKIINYLLSIFYFLNQHSSLFTISLLEIKSEFQIKYANSNIYEFVSN